MANIPFSYSELMRLPIKAINFIYKKVSDEHERKTKMMKENSPKMNF